MPYAIKYKRGDRHPYKILKDGKVVGSSSSRLLAERSVKARLAAEHGAKLTGRRRR